MNGLFLLKPTVFGDDRGYFYESYNAKRFTELTGVQDAFVQDNQSLSQKNVLRGLHFQNPPHAQGKLVRVLQGAVQDVVVDIRKSSPHFGRYFEVELTAENNLQLYIPPGFAHGFLTLEDNTIFVYKCTDFYNKNSEGCILWNDASLGINWKTEHPIVSEKDKLGQRFEDFTSLF
ncbi:MAG: dTDP-4-dehydrorhamnose 3,5-epimerase [Cryomorphaceae bacterium]|nr:MAG: dTDP-4-dehydrorhamnose 3,5-epimerase [Cryomorphaceae bacterium]